MLGSLYGWRDDCCRSPLGRKDGPGEVCSPAKGELVFDHVFNLLMNGITVDGW